MNQLNVNQTGGFPMTTRILDELQKAFRVFNTFGAIVGDKTIISGCVTTGTNVSDGVVYVNNETFDFVGGTVQTKVKIVEAPETLVFEDNTAKTVIRKRYVTFGTGVGAMDWADFTRGFETKGIEAALTAINSSLTTIGTKLATIDEHAKVQLQSDFNQTDNTKKDYIKNKPPGAFLAKGTYVIGDVAINADSRTITFSDIGTSNYMVLGNLVSKGDPNADNGITCVIKNKTAAGFVILLGNERSPTNAQNLEFDYVIIAK